MRAPINDRTVHFVHRIDFKRDCKHAFAISRHHLPEVWLETSGPLEIEGAGKTGCTLHPRSRVQTAHKNAHEHTGSAEAFRPSLRNGFTAYIVLSSVTGLDCHRRP
jgi:hypothetical protein